MERGPDNVLVEEASVRRESFPVAAVVVVHDDISLMRATLEEVAWVVEYMVSKIIGRGAFYSTNRSRIANNRSRPY